MCALILIFDIGLSLFECFSYYGISKFIIIQNVELGGWAGYRIPAHVAIGIRENSTAQKVFEAGGGVVTGKLVQKNIFC